MAWRSRFVDAGKERAVALGGQRGDRKWQGARQQARHPSSAPSRQCSAPRTWTRQERDDARKQHADNVERARQSAIRDQERQRRQFEDARKQQDERNRGISDERAQRERVAAQIQMAGNKRPQTGTISQSRTQRGAKRVKSEDEKLLVWDDSQLAFRETLSERAMHEGSVAAEQIDINLIGTSIRDGTAILCDRDGKTAATQRENASEWKMVSKWKELVSGLVVLEDCQGKARVQSDGGKGSSYIGSGTFNIVLEYPGEYRPVEHASNVAWRVTRPDKDNGEYKYQSFDTCLSEMHNALFCSANGIGVPMHGVCAFEAPRTGRALRYGIVMAMMRAKCDLTRKLNKVATELEGGNLAEKAIDLLYRASRMGILFVDIKPANMLVMDSGSDGEYFVLTDYDPAFFLRTDKDWHSLLLVNLALLSAHVHNADVGPAGRGWAKAVSPILRQLVNLAPRYDSAWLFETRAVCVKFKQPLDRSNFQRQRLLASMWSAYFYNQDTEGLRSKRYPWKDVERNNAQLSSHWKRAVNLESWPPEWKGDAHYPLISQIVDFALQFA